MSEYTRRSQDNEEDTALKKDMMSALSTIQDPGQKIVLMLLIRSIDSISLKLNRVLADDETLKEIVLNGSAKDHDAHHRWITEQLAKSTETTNTLNFVKDRVHSGGYCDYAKRKLQDEENSKIDSRKVKTGLIEKVLLVLLGSIFSALVLKYFGIEL